MNFTSTGIRAVGFDLDGTFYQDTYEIKGLVRTEIAKAILKKKKI